MSTIPFVEQLPLAEPGPGQIGRFWLQITSDPLGEPIAIPVIVVRGQSDGPTLGLTALLHGNELNGLAVISTVMKQIDARQLRGTVIGVPVLNVPGFRRNQRQHSDGTDLNRIMPGKIDGNDSELYAYRLVQKLLPHFDYLIDLHTASFGRVNSHYVRADMNQPAIAELARRQNAQIILSHEAGSETWRGTAVARGIPALTVEVGDPHFFQPDPIQRTVTGVTNAMSHLKMTTAKFQAPAAEAIACQRSYWIYTDQGGVLEVFPGLTERLQPGQPIAELRTIFGELICQYTAPEAGVVIGKSIQPVNQSGGRILHLGIA